MLYTSAEALDELGPIHFRADYPGYEQLEIEFRAQHVVNGLAEYDFELVPTARGFGSLLIDVHGWTGNCPTFENPRGAAAACGRLHPGVRGRGYLEAMASEPSSAARSRALR